MPEIFRDQGTILLYNMQKKISQKLIKIYINLS